MSAPSPVGAEQLVTVLLEYIQLSSAPFVCHNRGVCRNGFNYTAVVNGSFESSIHLVLGKVSSINVGHLNSPKFRDRKKSRPVNSNRT
jgi:hypothetical protein